MIPVGVKILSASFFTIFFGYNGAQQFLTSYFSDLGIVKTGFWSLILIYFSLTISNFFSGFIVSRFGTKKCLIFGALFYSLFIFSLISRNIFFIYSASVLLGFGAAILWTAQGTFLVKASVPNYFGRNSGFFNVFQQLGTVVGIVITGILIIKFSFSISFLILGFLPLIAGLILFLLKKTDSREVNFPQNLFFLKKLGKNPYFLKMGLIWFSFSLVLASVAGRFPLEIKEHFNLGSIGFILPIFYFLPIISSYYFGKISDIKGRNIFLIFSLFLISIGFLLFTIQKWLGLDFLIFITSFFLVSLGYAIFASIKFAMLGDVSSGDNLEYAAALFNQFGNLGYVVILLFNIYFSVTLTYLVSFLIVFTSLIIILPVLKLNMRAIKEKINLQ